MLGELLAHRAVRAVARDDEIGVGEREHVVDAPAVLDLDADPLACLLQRIQHVDARGSREMVAAHLHVMAAMHDVEVVAPLVVRRELVEEFLVGVAQEREPNIRKHDTPAESVVRTIALDDRDLVSRIDALHEKRQI